MNRPLFALLCAAAALAGWGGMAWWRGAGVAAGKTAIHSPAGGATAPGDFARPATKPPPGANPGLSAMAKALTQARALNPDDDEALAKLNALPPGTARDLAQALLAARRAAREGAESPPFNPFADLPADALSAAAWPDTMRGELLAGKPLREFAEAGDQSTEPLADPFGSSGEPEFDMGDITRWAGLDPAAASETILQMPPGKSRTASVDAAAKFMSRDNPQAAWDLVLKSGEQKLGEGAALAWLECAISPAGTGEQGLAKLPASLREAVLNHTAALLNRNEASAGPRTFTEDELSGLAAGLKGVAFGPGKEALLRAMLAQDSLENALRNPNEFSANIALSVMTYEGEEGQERMPEMEVFLGRQAALAAAARPAELLDLVHDLLRPLGEADRVGEYRLQLNGVASAATEILPALARAGHVKEVAPLVERIPDPQQRRAALESILPQWMDADPAAARAAFNAAPFTALERERWQRHPAFLLNPDSGR